MVSAENADLIEYTEEDTMETEQHKNTSEQHIGSLSNELYLPYNC